jgi:hypothetical protein
MSLFDQLSGFQFPDVLMNSGPLPSTAGGPAGSDGSVDGVINGTSALLGNISPYAIGKSARTGSDRNYQQIPHRFQYIIPKLFLPHFDHGRDRCIPVSHAVDQGDIAFLLFGGERAWFTSKEQFRSKAPPCAFAGIEVVNYILLCLQASVHADWSSICEDLIKHTAFSDALKRRRKKQNPEPFDDLHIFRAMRMLVQQCFVPHGICAGSEHQGGQHEHDGGQPVQATVNFVTTMTVDGKNVDLVNYWYRKNMLAGDELIFRLDLQEITTKTFELSSYYKQPVSETVKPNNAQRPRYWQLVPDILRGKPKLDPDEHWHEHRSEGYWRIAQTFQTRNQNSSGNAFTRGLPLEVTFSPVWHSFSDCNHAYGKAFVCAVEQYDRERELMVHINTESMIWMYQSLEVFSIRKVQNGYHITHDPTQCKLMVNGTVLSETQPETTQQTLTKIQFMCFNKTTQTRAAFQQTFEPGEPVIPAMKKYVSRTNNDVDHIEVESTITARGAGQNALDFHVKMVLQPAKNGGFLYNFCNLSPDKYLFQNGIWIKEEPNYKMLKSLQITYTNADREGRRPLLAIRKTLRLQNWSNVKKEMERNNRPVLLNAVLSMDETLMPHVEMPSLSLDVCLPPPTAEALATHEADACPTAESFGLPAQADAAGPRKKKTKVLRFLSAGESGESVPDVSTAGSGH